MSRFERLGRWCAERKWIVVIAWAVLVGAAVPFALQAPGARTAAVRLRYAADQLGVEVTDVGDAAPDGERALLGMHERVALYGGELVAEAVAGSGYAVRARLPLEIA